MVKPFLQWLVVTLASFGLLAGASHAWLTAYPERILVIVDTSFPMRDVGRKVDAIVNSFMDRGYRTYALYTEKALVHGWGPAIKQENFSFYAPRSWTKLSEMRANREFSEAGEIILITNAAEKEVTEFSSWRIVSPE